MNQAVIEHGDTAAPDGITLGAEPLRSVIGEHCVADEKQSAEHAQMKTPDRVHGSRLLERAVFGEGRNGFLVVAKPLTQGEDSG
ncbi:MAG: hypothetical protein ABSD29_12330 [Verrucomicrobiota bacterium]